MLATAQNRSPGTERATIAATAIIALAALCLLPSLASSQPGPDVPDGGSDVEQPRITNVFFDTNIRQALSDIAAQAGVSIVPDLTVQGIVSLELNEVPLERALRLVLLAGGFVFLEVEPAVYLITSPVADSPNYALIAKSELVNINYLSKEELESLLPLTYQSYVRVNSLGTRAVITAPADILPQVVAHIRRLDVPPVQVMLEALVVERLVSNEEMADLRLQSARLGISNSGGMITYVEEAERILLELLWLASRRQAEIKASPRVIAQVGQEASVRVVVEQFFQILTGRAGFEYATLQAIEAAIGLTITPRVALPERMITCQIEPEVSDVIGSTVDQLPIITRREATTTVRVADGQVIAIGGLLEEVETEIRRRIPLIGDLPIIGGLFRSKDTISLTREVTIFLVPHILDDNGRYDGALLMDRVATPDLEDTAVEQVDVQPRPRGRVSDHRLP